MRLVSAVLVIMSSSRCCQLIEILMRSASNPRRKRRRVKVRLCVFEACAGAKFAFERVMCASVRWHARSCLLVR